MERRQADRARNIVVIPHRLRNTLISSLLCVASMVAYYAWQDALIPISAVRMRLTRGSCTFQCPSYSVDIYGDGRVVYQGYDHVAVRGKLSYAVPAAQATALYAAFKRSHFATMKSSYVAAIADQPTDFITLQRGRNVKSIKDYAGQIAGMPVVIGDLEQQIDTVAQTRSLIKEDAATQALLVSGRFTPEKR